MKKTEIEILDEFYKYCKQKMISTDGFIYRTYFELRIPRIKRLRFSLSNYLVFYNSKVKKDAVQEQAFKELLDLWDFLTSIEKQEGI